MAANPVSFRDASRNAQLKTMGLKALEPRLKAEAQSRRERLDREAKLHEQIFEPIGKLLDQPSTRQAMEELQRIDSQKLKDWAPLGGVGHHGSLIPHPFSIVTHPGSVTARPPLDDSYTKILAGNPSVAADKDLGTCRVAVAANKDQTSQNASAGVQLVVWPQSADNVLLAFPTLLAHYNYLVHTEAGPTAHSDGYLNVTIFVHDAQGNVIDSLTQNSGEQIWSDGSSGLHDNHGEPGKDIVRTPSFFLRGGASYEMWFWIQNVADAGSNFFGGWSEAISSLNLTVSSVQVAQL
jgi:hypothetical protein